MNPLKVFGSTSSYKEMLAKIGASTFFVLIGLITLLRHHFKEFDGLLSPFSVEVKYLGFPLPFGTFLWALILAIVFSRMLKLHDRLSDIFRIRLKFDTKIILQPMAQTVGASKDSQEINSLI
jgi:hypothetical protein